MSGPCHYFCKKKRGKERRKEVKPISLNKKDVKDVVVSVWVVRIGWNMNMAGYTDVIVGREKEQERKKEGKKMVRVVGGQTMYVCILLT